MEKCYTNIVSAGKFNKRLCFDHPADSCVSSKRKAFSTAEILITIVIVAIIATLALPILLVKYHEKQTVVKVKKAYSTLASAYQMAIFEHGYHNGWNLAESEYNSGRSSDNFEESIESQEGRDQWLDVLSPYIDFKARKSYSECYADTNKKYFTLLNGRVTGEIYCPLADLPDGISIVHYNYDSYSGEVDLMIDVNGDKEPNIVGKDVFPIYFIVDKGISLINTEDDFKDYVKDNCLDWSSASYGYGCTAWLMHYGNMDYLHCDNLDPETRIKCN